MLLVEQAQPDGIAAGIGSGPRSARERSAQQRRPPCARAPCPLHLCRTIPSASAHQRASRSSPRRAPGPSSPLPAACRGPGCCSCGGRSCDDQELGLLVVVGWADATENGRAGCAPIWASSPTCVPQRQPKNSASRVARCPPRAPLDQQSSNGVAIAPGGRALCTAASARYLAGTARPPSSICTTRGGSITLYSTRYAAELHRSGTGVSTGQIPKKNPAMRLENSAMRRQRVNCANRGYYCCAGSTGARVPAG